MKAMSSTAKKLWLGGLALAWGGVGWASWARPREAAALREEIAERKIARDRQRAGEAEQARRVRELEQALAQQKEECAKREVHSTTRERQQRAVQAAIMALKADGERSAATGAALPAARRVPPPSGMHGNVYFPELFADPRYAHAYLAWQRQQIEQRFAPLFRELTLAPEELARFKEVLAQREMAYEEVDGIMENEAMRERKSLDRNQAMQVKLRVVRAFDAEIAQRFGAQVLAQYREFQNGSGARQGIVGKLAARLSYSAAPLDAVQTARLVALFNSTRGLAISAGRAGGSPAGASEEAFAAGAEAILRPEQVTALREVQAEQAAGRGGSSVGIRQTTGTTGTR